MLVMFETVVGAEPAPPPTTSAFAANAPELAQVVPLEKYGIPPDVPAIVNAGVVVAFATETIPPVHPTDVTVPLPAAVAHESVPLPFVESTWPDDPSTLGNVQVTFAAVPAGPLRAT